MNPIDLKISARLAKPEVKEGESQGDYMGRCIPWAMNTEGLSQDQAKGRCTGMWESHLKKNGGFESVGKFVEQKEYNAPEETRFGDLIVKKGEELRLVTGIVLEPEVADGQGDIYSEDEIRKTAHAFMVNYQGQGNGFMHKSYGSKDLLIVESYCAPVDFELNKQQIKKGTWLMTTLVLSDVVWKSVKEGRITGYSIRGYSNVREES